MNCLRCCCILRDGGSDRNVMMMVPIRVATLCRSKPTVVHIVIVNVRMVGMIGTGMSITWEMRAKMTRTRTEMRTIIATMGVNKEITKPPMTTWSNGELLDIVMATKEYWS
jgi:hypothetical protein